LFTALDMDLSRNPLCQLTQLENPFFRENMLANVGAKIQSLMHEASTPGPEP
jgi:hypothetical protein